MNKQTIKYGAYAKALPPQPIRFERPGWGGADLKMEDGSEPQPWHCLPFVEAATYGLELVYQYDTECHVVNDGGELRFEWDFTREPGGVLTGGEFIASYPKPSRHYLFNSRLDIQAPPGYVLRTGPHPRFFTDYTGTVPPALMGHVQSEWWPKKLFLIFKAPRPGERHIFRKGEPYAQILFVPQRMSYETVPFDVQEESHRRELEASIDLSRGQIADNVWHNPSGNPFDNHYKILSRAFSRDGAAGVEQTIRDAVQRHHASLPADKSIPQCLEIGHQLLREQKHAEAKAIFYHVLEREPENADALSHLGVCIACRGSPMAALEMMRQAVIRQPASPVFLNNLGELHRMLSQLGEAEAAFRSVLRLTPDDAGVLSTLGLVLAQQGRLDEGLAACRGACALNPNLPVAQFRLGRILGEQRQYAQARACYEAALALDPGFAHAQRALQELPIAP
jgi:Flp pilus assembly protein TadD